MMMNRMTVTILALALAAGTVSGQQLAAPEVEGARAALDDLLELMDEHQGKDQDVGHSLELRRLLRGAPELVPEIPTILVRDTPSLDTSSVMILALEVIGTPPAQAALVDIHGDRGQRHMDRLRAVIAAGGVKQPTQGAISGLWSAAGHRGDGLDLDVSNTAILSLGVAGSRLRESKPTAYAPLRESLVAGLHGTPETDERSMFLKAVGNLHDTSLGIEVLPYLFDESVPVRASAAQSLGLMEDATALPVLVQIFEAEERGVVRAEIVSTFRALPPDLTSLTAVHHAVLDEIHPEARAQMAAYLTEHLASFEEARPTLVHLFATDPTERVRKIVSAALPVR